jgi:hypothetical protein
MANDMNIIEYNQYVAIIFINHIDVLLLHSSERARDGNKDEPVCPKEKHASNSFLAACPWAKTVCRIYGTAISAFSWPPVQSSVHGR